MKTVIIFFIICVPSFSIAQNRICKEIKITHTAEDLYSLPIVPIGCNENQKHGPIIVSDVSTPANTTI